MIMTIPEYLNKKTLPFASDILFHQRINVFLPTGFHPTEINSVLNFPTYCRDNEIALPQIIWDSTKLYFEADREALDCLNILEPLRKEYIKSIIPIYSRGKKEIEECKTILRENPDLFGMLNSVDYDSTFLSRELLSHILYEIFVESGYEGVVGYIRENAETFYDFNLLASSVLLNRIRMFAKADSSYLIYNHSWYPVLNKISDLFGNSEDMHLSDSRLVDHFGYKLFEAILYPIYERCDSLDKNKKIAKIARTETKLIDEVKKECLLIAEEVVLMPTADRNLKQKRLSDQLEKRIITPLGELSNRGVKDIKGIIKDFIVDSTVVGGMLSMVEKPDPLTLKLSLATGAVAAGTKYLLRDKVLEMNMPTQTIVNGMKTMACEYSNIRKAIEEISLETIDISGKLI